RLALRRRGAGIRAAPSPGFAGTSPAEAGEDVDCKTGGPGTDSLSRAAGEVAPKATEGAAGH
ncbi:MAG: hypothetical protein KIT69_21850, partial [Propionibacteriaceae bacterium]|nr:hypothetical protein [Propionibacteriaceae bacterium]